MVTTKNFGKYIVTLEIFEEDGEQRSYCDIENKNTGASGSLGMAQDMGILEKDHDGEEAISENVLSKIEAWAESNGY